jgi:hypothetical protein
VGSVNQLDVLIWDEASISLWLLCLPPEHCRSVTLPNMVWESSIRLLPELEERWKGKIRPQSSKEPIGTVDVGFVSGSKSFLITWAVVLKRFPWIYCLEGRARKLADLPGSPTTISHQSVGGVSTHQLVFGAVGFEQDLRMTPTVLRCLHHVIKYSERPHPAPEQSGVGVLTEDSRVSLNQLEGLIHYRTHMSPTGWGSRPLVAAERRGIFDVPSWGNNAVPIFELRTPLKAFMAIGRLVLHSIGRTIDPSTRLASLSIISVPSKPAVTMTPEAVYLSDLGVWLPGTWAAGHALADKAAKNDDQQVQLAPWRARIELALSITLSAKHWTALERFVMNCYSKRLFRSLIRYLHHSYGADFLKRYHERPNHFERPRKRRKKGGVTVSAELFADIRMGIQVLQQNLRSTHWDWDYGSVLVFWRWADAEQRRAARDGMNAYIWSPLPADLGETSPRIKLQDQKQVFEKIYKHIQHGYLAVGPVKHLLHYFAVPKGTTDVRMVYDGTKGGLNEALWAPSFYIPDLMASTWFLDYDSWIFDLDYGECFSNFPQCPELKAYSGISLRPFAVQVRELLPELLNPQDSVLWIHWTRLFMGCTSSPFGAVRYVYWLDEMVRGDPHDQSNPFRYDRVNLNLPGMSEFDPTRPKVMKWDSVRGCVAADFVTFMDDLRGGAPGANEAWLARDRVAKTIQHKGCQDAPRKAGYPNKSPQPWTGGLVRMDGLGIYISLPLDKWNKVKAILAFYANEIAHHPQRRPMFSHKTLERKLGFLCHAAQTVKELRPFLRGFYDTLNSWRPTAPDKSREEVWYGTEQPNDAHFDLEEFAARYLHNEEFRTEASDTPPVKASEGLEADICALMSLTSSDTPVERYIRHNAGRILIYGFTDASGTGGGASFERQLEEKYLTYRVSVWSVAEREESSNWKEFDKLVESLEDEAAGGGLKRTAVYMFTDNSTVEAAIHSGRSSSPRLRALVIRFLSLQTRNECSIEVFHVAGTRMIAQGTDGISRGALNEGVMNGMSMMSFIPLHLSAVDRSPTLQDWLKSWLPGSPQVLEPVDWFQLGHGIVGYGKNFEQTLVPVLCEPSQFVWTPPPYVADVAVAELRKSRLKRMQHLHVFVCPRLCSPMWRRHFFKAADLVIEIPPGFAFWPAEMHEPLIIGILFPFIRSAPWQLRGTPRIYAVAREVRRMCKGDKLDPGPFLCQLCADCLRLRSMPEHVVRRMLYFEGKS